MITYVHSRKPFSFSLLYMISLAYKIQSQCLPANHYPELRRVICTGVTLFALVLHLNCTSLSQLESSNFFMCIISNVSIIVTKVTMLFVRRAWYC